MQMRGVLASSHCVHVVVCWIWPERNPACWALGVPSTRVGAGHPRAGRGERRSFQERWAGAAQAMVGAGQQQDVPPAPTAPSCPGDPPTANNSLFAAPCTEAKACWDMLTLRERSPVPERHPGPGCSHNFPGRFFPWSQGTRAGVSLWGVLGGGDQQHGGCRSGAEPGSSL